MHQEATARKSSSAKARCVFEEVNALPHAQQEEVMKFVARFAKSHQEDTANSNR
jgi:hypothetical protein